MIKQAPRPGQIVAMVAFTLSCFGILLFLWTTFGGSLPLKPESYRFEAAISEATTLSVEADVRISGVNVGKVKRKGPDPRSNRTLLELEIKPEYAPIARDARAILRQKTLLGESYIEIAPGRRSAGTLEDGGRLADAQVEPTTELDELFGSFDRPTREALAESADELARALPAGRGRDVNAALGNLSGTVSDGSTLLAVLDEQDAALRRLIRNGAGVLGAINDRRGAAGDLVADANEAFAATASRDRELAESIRVLPTFLDETRATLRRVARFSGHARPLVRDLGPVADDLGPTTADLAALAPHLERAFKDLGPLFASSRRGLPALRRVAEGAEPLVESLHPFLDELNPILSLLGFHQARVAGFLSNGGAALNYQASGERAQAQTLVIDPRSFSQVADRPEWDRGNAYHEPNAFNRTFAFGAIESTDCRNAIGPRNSYGDVAQYDALDAPPLVKMFERRPGCVQAGPSLYGGRIFPLLRAGRPRLRRPPQRVEGTTPADESRPIPPSR